MSEHDQEWIAERDLTEKLGVPRDVVRLQRRELNAGEVKAEGNVIFWLKNAAMRCAAALGLPLGPAPEKNGGESMATPTAAVPTALEGEELTVYSSPRGPRQPHFANPHLFKAIRANGEVVVVRVLASSKFLPKLGNGTPMTFRAKKAAAGNWWNLIGREPRFPGMW